MRAPPSGESPTTTLPPWARTTDATMARPRPAPPLSELRALSSRPNRRRMRSRSSAATPGPSSSTWIRMQSVDRSTATSTRTSCSHDGKRWPSGCARRARSGARRGLPALMRQPLPSPAHRRRQASLPPPRARSRAGRSCADRAAAASSSVDNRTRSSTRRAVDRQCLESVQERHVDAVGGADGQLDLTLQCHQRRPQFVGGVGGELALGRAARGDAIEHVVDGARQVLDLVVGVGDRHRAW